MIDCFDIDRWNADQFFPGIQKIGKLLGHLDKAALVKILVYKEFCVLPTKIKAPSECFRSLDYYFQIAFDINNIVNMRECFNFPLMMSTDPRPLSTIGKGPSRSDVIFALLKYVIGARMLELGGLRPLVTYPKTAQMVCGHMGQDQSTQVWLSWDNFKDNKLGALCELRITHMRTLYAR